MQTAKDVAGGRIAGLELRPVAIAELLDVRGVAELLGCSRRHVYRMADSGHLPRPVRLGTLVRWRLVELKSWIDDGCPTVRVAKGPSR